LRIVLWGTLSALAAGVAFVALVPGPDLPPLYGDLSALHDSLVRTAAEPSDGGSGLLGRVEASVSDATATVWLYRHDGAMVSVHRLDRHPPRPRGATSVAGAPDGTFAFERGEILFLVVPTDESATLVVGYASITLLRSMLDTVLVSGPGPDAVQRVKVRSAPDSPPRPAEPPGEPSEP
jgi:hypothetical protein